MGMVVNALAVGCGLNVAPAQAQNLPAITIVLWFVVLTALMREASAFCFGYDTNQASGW